MNLALDPVPNFEMTVFSAQVQNIVAVAPDLPVNLFPSLQLRCLFNCNSLRKRFRLSSLVLQYLLGSFFMQVKNVILNFF